jgi:hypothetical protein
MKAAKVRWSMIGACQSLSCRALLRALIDQRGATKNPWRKPGNRLLEKVPT